MSIIRLHALLWSFLATSLFSGIKEVHVVTLNDDRKIVLFGDNHVRGSYPENVEQAYWVYDFISRFQKQNPDKSIILLPESPIYAPEGLNQDDIKKLLLLGIEDLVGEEHFYKAKKIRSSLFLEKPQIIRPGVTGETTWIGLEKSTLLPILSKFYQIPNVSIISCDPRYLSNILGYDIPQQQGFSVFDIVGFAPVFIERYWHEAWKKDLSEEYHDYFNKHYTNMPKALISTVIRETSEALNISEEEVFFKNIKDISFTQKSILQNNVQSTLYSAYTSICKINTIFESELLYQILRTENQDSKKMFFAFIGASHSQRILKTLYDLHLIKTKNSAEFKLRSGNHIFIKSPIKFAAIKLGIDLDNNNDVSELLSDVNEWLNLSANFLDNDVLDNDAFKNIQGRITKLYLNNDAPRDENGYSFLSYLIDFCKSPIWGEIPWPISNVNKLIELAIAAGADPNTIEPDGKTPIIQVLQNIWLDDDFSRHRNTLELLCSKGANLINPKVRALLKAVKTKIPDNSFLYDLFYHESNDEEINHLKRKDYLYEDNRINKKRKYELSLKEIV